MGKYNKGKAKRLTREKEFWDKKGNALRAEIMELEKLVKIKDNIIISLKEELAEAEKHVPEQNMGEKHKTVS